jgi:hypothetical protein
MPKTLILSLLVLAACADAPTRESNFTWRDAQAAYAGAWCTWLDRCDGALLVETFDDVNICTTVITSSNCILTRSCDRPYPRDFDDVVACVADMLGLACASTSAPQSCIDAFAGSYQ